LCASSDLSAEHAFFCDENDAIFWRRLAPFAAFCRKQENAEVVVVAALALSSAAYVPSVGGVKC
jgi:hypothetical protein